MCDFRAFCFPRPFSTFSAQEKKQKQVLQDHCVRDEDLFQIMSHGILCPLGMHLLLPVFLSHLVEVVSKLLMLDAIELDQMFADSIPCLSG